MWISTPAPEVSVVLASSDDTIDWNRLVKQFEHLLIILANWVLLNEWAILRQHKINNSQICIFLKSPNKLGSRTWFMSCPLPLCQNKSSCETIHMKMRFVAKFILMQIKLIFTSFAQGLVLKQRQKTTRRRSDTNMVTYHVLRALWIRAVAGDMVLYSSARHFTLSSSRWIKE